MSVITTLNPGDSGAVSRVVINTNFTNLNTDKLEGVVASGNIPVGTGGATLADSGVPATGLVTATSANVFTNKSINLLNNTLTGTIAEFNTACTDADFLSTTGVDNLLNKTITNASNDVTANSLRTSGASVDVSASAPPTVGQTLVATSATTATWQAGGGGSGGLYYAENAVAPVTPPSVTLGLIAIGDATVSSGTNAIAVGNGAVANLAESICIGTSAVDNGALASISIGEIAGSSDRGVVVGHQAGCGIRGVVMGFGSFTVGDDSVAIGYNTNAVGQLSVAVGQAANASNLRSIALGANVQTVQDDSIVIGDPANTALFTGFGTSVPKAKVHIEGSFATRVTQIPATPVITLDEHHIVLVDATGGSGGVILPNGAQFTGREYTIKKIDATANIVLITSISLIDGSGVSPVLTLQNESMTVSYDGTDWWITSKYL